MSRHYILDGYNVLHSTERWDSLPREAKREAFLRYLEETRPAGSAKNTLTVVLDGYSANLQKMRFTFVRLLFSEERDADTVIKERVADLSHPPDAVVVTNDRAVRNAVRGLGAQVMSCEDFFLLKKKRAALRHVGKMDVPGAEVINRELRRLWKLDEQ